MIRSVILAAAVAAGLFAAPALAADDKCLADPPANPDAAFYKSRIAACTQSLSVETDSDLRLLIFTTRAEAYLDTKSYVRALGDMQQWLAADPQSPDALHDIALVHGYMGYYTLALSEEASAVQFGDTSNDGVALRALWEALLGRSEEAINDANRAISEKPSSPAYGARGYSELQLGQMPEAISDFGEVLKLFPDDGETYHFRGLALYGVDRYAEALADFQKAQKLAGDDFSDDEYIREVQAIMSLPPADGTQEAQQNAPSHGVGRTHNCSAYYPVMAVQLNERATVLVHYDVTAESVVTNVGVERPSGDTVLDQAAVVCVRAHWRSKAAIQNGKPVATRQMAQIIFTLPSASPDRRAQALARLGRYDEAIAAYTESLNTDPKSANTYFRRGFAHYLKREYAEAGSDFAQAVALKPDFDEAKAARELVQAAVIAKGHNGKDI